MTKQVLPVYAMVELLIRLDDYNSRIGDYKGHKQMNGYVQIKTTGGSINFANHLVIQQFSHPELITTDALASLAAGFLASAY